MEHIFSLWPTLSDLARDLDKPYQTVAAWSRRGSIPARYDLDLIDCARKRGHSLSLNDLAEARQMKGAAA